MNYRHLYHAGNFADVMKHIVLIELLNHLKQKQPGFCYIDTHAGAGFYDLSSPIAQKTKEYDRGVKLVLQQTEAKEFEIYRSIINSYNPDKNINYYPGSPLIALACLRTQDQAILNELQPDDFVTLKRLVKKDKRVSCHQRDAYEFLPAVLPPTLKRGLVLIDPPYENKHEIEIMLTALQKSLQRWPQATYMIWFPIKEKNYHSIYHSFAKAGIDKFLTIEFTVSQIISENLGLTGSGLIIINPPWQIDKILNKKLIDLWKLLSPQNYGHVKIN